MGTAIFGMRQNGMNRAYARNMTDKYNQFCNDSHAWYKGKSTQFILGGVFEESILVPLNKVRGIFSVQLEQQS